MKKTDTVKEMRSSGNILDHEKTRYSDEELQEFKILILSKLDDAKKEAQTLQDMLRRAHDNGTDDTARTFKNLEDGSDTLAKEELGQLVSRQQKFIEQLESALVRIETKSYGICHLSGKLIPKERLRIVPHTTQTIEAKLSQEK
jgi:DnaK suppressor protein